MTASTHLATYGTLSPGKPNHHHLATLSGVWLRGKVRGDLVEEGWGAAQGFPALILNASGPLLDVDLFQSEELPGHWKQLDAFEGDGYRRVAVMVETPSGLVEASIYVTSGNSA